MACTSHIPRSSKSPAAGDPTYAIYLAPDKGLDFYGFGIGKLLKHNQTNDTWGGPHVTLTSFESGAKSRKKICEKISKSLALTRASTRTHKWKPRDIKISTTKKGLIMAVLTMDPTLSKIMAVLSKKGFIVKKNFHVTLGTEAEFRAKGIRHINMDDVKNYLRSFTWCLTIVESKPMIHGRQIIWHEQYDI